MVIDSTYALRWVDVFDGRRAAHRAAARQLDQHGTFTWDSETPRSGPSRGG